ncbi:Rne/Rng family ribonuclease [Schinkia azotoformans]|uniref:Rne/Rng family ribonuclease n=2 Tax=Schinkia azotoformans TaxID=1454 RepID=UPI002DBFC16B|nr:Rne/Rng family ribonuclease [Schinkia azotoformans]MEC1742068.1 Rne/Rng family ribonuclease [Schinkia azotoformans]MEC1765044.1 Rne/Rng family ribonuclease [Schinkia azotoformans]MED4419701.1 Rne/Rng family ribonuclease [Schinkia azotoformans]
MRKIIMNCRTTEKRAALVENDQIVELFVESAEAETIVGNIYKGRIEKVTPGMQAAFVNIGLERNGFLQIDQLANYKPLDPNEKRKVSISNLLHEGQEVVVQVTKDSFGEKGPRLKTLLELSGRFLVYMPNDPQIAVSKKMDEAEREVWRRFGQALCNENEGLIFQTACAQKAPEVVQKEIEYLKKCWSEITKAQSTKKTPSLLYKNADLIEFIVQDLIGDEPTEIIVDDGTVFRALKERISIYDDAAAEINHFMNKEDIFSYFGIEQEIERSLNPFVELENGISLMIEQTEAMTVIDVNSGKFTGKHHAKETILNTNELAALEIARQLRLRNIGGIIIIDFINMESQKDREFIKNKLNAALRTDRNYTKVYGFTQLGLLEMTRKKEQKSLLEKLTTTCPTCHNVGRVYSPEQVTHQLERALWEYKGIDHEAVWVEVPTPVLELFKANANVKLKQLEETLGYKILLTSTGQLINNFEVRNFGTESEIMSRISKKKTH